MERVTNAALEVLIRGINRRTGLEFGIDSANGGVKLVRYCESGGEDDMTPYRLNKSELYRTLCAIENILDALKNDGDGVVK